MAADRPASASALAMEENSEAAMQKLLAPHLARMRQEMGSISPGSDPELSLISWLCERNYLKPPLNLASKMRPDVVTSPLRRGQKSEVMPVPFGPPHQLSEDAPLADIKPAPFELGSSGFSIKPGEHSDKNRLNLWAERRDEVKDLTYDMQQGLREKLLSKVPLISGILSEKEFRELAGRLQLQCFSSQQRIVQQGVVGHELFVMQEGRCDVLQDSGNGPVSVGELGQGGFFGELAMVYQRPYAATVVARTNVVCLSFSICDLCLVMGPYYFERLRSATHVRVLGTIPLLSKLWFTVKSQIADVLKTDTWLAGSELMKQNAFCSTPKMYILEAGKCTKTYEVFTKECLQPRKPESVNLGDQFGMLSMFFGSASTYTITAETSSTTVSISRAELMQISESCDEGSLMKSDMQSSMQCHLLRQIEELKGFDDTILSTLAQHATTATFKQWDIILYKGKKPEGVVMELEADLQVPQNTNDQHQYSQSHHGQRGHEHSHPGWYCGMPCIRDRGASSKTTLVARTPCTILCIAGNVMRTVFKRQRPAPSKASFDPMVEII